MTLNDKASFCGRCGTFRESQQNNKYNFKGYNYELFVKPFKLRQGRIQDLSEGGARWD